MEWEDMGGSGTICAPDDLISEQGYRLAPGKLATLKDPYMEGESGGGRLCPFHKGGAFLYIEE